MKGGNEYMLWIFNKKKIIEQHRRDAVIQACQLISDSIKVDIKQKAGYRILILLGQN
jgi:hypothetical protein